MVFAFTYRFELTVPSAVAVKSEKNTAAKEYCFTESDLIKYGLYAILALVGYSLLLLGLAFGVYKCASCCKKAKTTNQYEENAGTRNTNGI